MLGRWIRTLTYVISILIFVTVIKARHPRTAEGRIRDYLLNQANYTTRDRPVLSSYDTIYVNLKMHLYAILNLNEKDEVITTASWLTMEWIDERLTWNPQDFDNIDLVTMYVDEIWTPSVFLANSLSSGGSSIGTSPHGLILLTSDGNIVFGEVFIQSSQCPISIRYFPFDNQRCVFEFSPGNELAERVYLTTEVPQNLHALHNLEWDLINVTSGNFFFTMPYYVNNRQHSNLTTSSLCVYLKRNPNYYIKTLIVPSTLLCIMSMTTFLAPPDSGERISLGVSIVLGLTVFQLLVADTLPTASKESPILSNYLTANFILACLAIPFSLGNINIAYGDTDDVAFFLKHSTIRKVFLEYLPRVLYTPSYRKGITNELVVNAKSTDVSVVNADTDENVTDVYKSCNNMKVHPIEPFTLKETISRQEKRKRERRIFAIVCDRLTLIVFLTAFAVVLLVTVNAFMQNPDIPDLNCSY